MNNCNKRSGVFAIVRRWIPTVILLGLTVLAGGYDAFTSNVHQSWTEILKQHYAQVQPHLVAGLLVASAVSIAWVLYRPLSCWVGNMIAGWTPREDLNDLGLNGFRLVYWGSVIYFTIAFFAPDLMGKLGQGVLLLAAALGVALQNQVGDFCCGLLLRLPNCLREGDYIKLDNGDALEGTVVEIGLMRTLIKTASGPRTIRNSVVWGCDISHPAVPSPVPADPTSPQVDPTTAGTAPAGALSVAPGAETADTLSVPATSSRHDGVIVEPALPPAGEQRDAPPAVLQPGQPPATNGDQAVAEEHPNEPARGGKAASS